MFFRGFILQAIPFAPVLAEEINKSFDWGQFANYGICGAILAWTLWRAEPRLRGIEAAIDRLTRMIAIMLTELPHVLEGAKAQCRVMDRELDAAARARGEKLEGE
jgi:hypothetical protein